MHCIVRPTGLQSLASGGTPAKWLIIDDGWQRTDVDPEFRAKPGEEVDKLTQASLAHIYRHDGGRLLVR